MIGGYYVVAIRRTNILALLVGPVADWRKAESLIDPARKAAGKRFSVGPLDGYGVAFMAFPVEIRGEMNADLWVNPEFVNYVGT